MPAAGPAWQPSCSLGRERPWQRALRTGARPAAAPCSSSPMTGTSQSCQRMEPPLRMRQRLQQAALQVRSSQPYQRGTALEVQCVGK